MKLSKKRELRQKRRWRIRKKVRGTAERPRLTICFTNKNIHVQCIDDSVARTLIATSTNEKDMLGVLPNLDGSAKLGKIFSERIKASGLTTVVFDRAGRKYHGCVKAFAEAVRDAGIVF
ncbi:MAG: 50S ribosomal protein L18 [Opitutae bacterium]|jgi:large subunit ribosomal protein L18|nr:50S ribosomal protein L18 [Opitutae bacterium]